MKDFYTNVAVDIDGYGSPKELLVVGFNDDGRYQSRIPIKDCDLHIFIDDPTRSSEYRTIDGRHVLSITLLGGVMPDNLLEKIKGLVIQNYMVFILRWVLRT